MTESTENPPINRWIIAIAVMLSTFMEVLDTTVVNVSLPHIAGSLSATPDEATWALTSYLVANAIILPMTGWLASRFGRKRLLMLAVTGFTAASFLCGFAPTLSALIVFRVIQGACGGGLQPISQAVLLETFPPEERGKAMGFWGLGIVVAPMLGPVLGGWITDSYSWRWVFYINVPVGILALVMTELFIFDPPYLRRTESRIDYWGIGFLAVGVASLQIVLDKGQEDDWFGSHFILTLAIIAAIALVIFIARELLTEHPVVDLRVFKVRTYSTGVFLMTLLGFGLYGGLVILPLLLQTLLGYPALQAGIALFPRGFGSFLMMPTVGFLLTRFDARKMLSAGVLVTAISFMMLGTLNLSIGYWQVFWPQLIQGLAMGMVFVPLTTITMDPIPNERMGNATSIFNLMRNLGGSMGIAASTTLVARREQLYFNLLGRHVNPYSLRSRMLRSSLQQMFFAKGADWATATARANALLFRIVERHSAMLAYNATFWTLAVIFIVMGPFILLMKRPRTRPGGIAAH